MAKKKTAKAKAAASPSPDETPDDDQEAAERPVAAPPPAPPSHVSVPARASCLTFIVLLLAALIVLVISLRDRHRVWDQWVWFVIVPLVFIIPIVVYRAVALWMFDEGSRFPDIAHAWRSGTTELARNGMSLSSAPLFLIIGTGDDRMRRSFMNASGGEFFVDGVCEEPSPLYWYVNEDGIFLYLNDISWINAVITLFEIHASALKSGQLLPSEQPRGGAGARKVSRALYTLRPGLLSPVPAQQRGANLPSDQGAPSGGASAASEGAHQAEPPAKSSSRYMGTLTPDQVAAPSSAAGPNAPAPIMGARSTAPVSKHVSNRLTSQESSEQLQRLEYLCGMLRRHRYPVCPANGILTLLPFQMLKAGDQDVEEFKRTITGDLSTIYRELQLRCPVTAVIVGMDQEKGFRELIRRIGHQDAAKQRFGQRFDVRVPATTDELRRFTTHVCGTFEDWVYTLFREEQALSHPGNTALYALLCKVRRTLKTRLGDVLGKGFGYDRQGGTIPLLFSGCYFAATGPKADRQAFVRGLLSKLYDEQEDIEWTPDALHEDHRRGWFAKIGWVVCGAILLALAGYIAYSLAR